MKPFHEAGGASRGSWVLLVLSLAFGWGCGSGNEGETGNREEGTTETPAESVCLPPVLGDTAADGGSLGGRRGR